MILKSYAHLRILTSHCLHQMKPSRSFLAALGAMILYFTLILLLACEVD